ncbi:hypothetical protein EOL96_03765 [Candidatus Saccharibacteria bacterium]|nr:hypothetical protein [Candidatus Saccharibacteria bacterium]
MTNNYNATPTSKPLGRIIKTVTVVLLALTPALFYALFTPAFLELSPYWLFAFLLLPVLSLVLRAKWRLTKWWLLLMIPGLLVAVFLATVFGAMLYRVSAPQGVVSSPSGAVSPSFRVSNDMQVRSNLFAPDSYSIFMRSGAENGVAIAERGFNIQIFCHKTTNASKENFLKGVEGAREVVEKQAKDNGTYIKTVTAQNENKDDLFLLYKSDINSVGIQAVQVSGDIISTEGYAPRQCYVAYQYYGETLDSEIDTIAERVLRSVTW